MDRELKIRRLLYQSFHRGCKETDLILGEFARLHLNDFSDEELDLYEQFLNENDWDIYAWLTNQQPLPTLYECPFMERLRAFRFWENVSH